MDPEALYTRGFEARCEGKYGEAKLYLEQVIKLAPGHFKAKHQLALILGFEGDFDGSVASLDALHKQVPRDLEVLYDLAMSQMMVGMMDEACGHFNKILAIDPTHDKANQQVAYTKSLHLGLKCPHVFLVSTCTACTHSSGHRRAEGHRLFWSSWFWRLLGL